MSDDSSNGPSNGAGAAWRWRLRTWSPDYDDPRADGGPPGPPPTVVADSEMPVAVWTPRTPPDAPGMFTSVAFVDGVQRIDAWADLDGPAGEAAEALFASFAAGAALVDLAAGRAQLVDPRIDRVVVGGPDGLGDLAFGGQRYRHVPLDLAAEANAGRYRLALERARDALEVRVAEAAAAELLVVDGPLHGRDHLLGVVGYVKSHRVEYLTEPALRATVMGLAPGQRTPLFWIEGTWSRWSWYVRLPGPAGPPAELGWAGLARCEASRKLAPAEAAELADRATATLCRFASSPVKDPRAPQNLVPIGGLERLLRHRLGEREQLERALRRLLASGGGPNSLRDGLIR